MIDQAAYLAACAATNNAPPSSIGTLGERTLHAVLKRYFEPNTAFHEVAIDGFVADIARPDGIIEIQTGSFARLRKKLPVFLARGRVTVVYPAVRTKYIRWIDADTGELSPPRRSPKRGLPCAVLPELFAIADVLEHPNFSLCVLVMDMEEHRLLCGWSHDKKRGSVRKERIPLSLHEELWIRNSADCDLLLPDGLCGVFTAKEFRKATALTSPLKSSAAMKLLMQSGVLLQTGKQGKAFLYERKRDGSNE